MRLPILLFLILPLSVFSRTSAQEKPCTILLPAGREATYDARPWIDGLIPYEFDSAVTQENRNRMLSAMQRWETLVAVNFTERGLQRDWVFIQNSTGNSAHVGRFGGKQEVNIFNWDIPRIIIHELGHSLGFWHEHQRPDRDSYVTIDFGNIQPGQEYNFQVRLFADALGAYDFDSIMHYPAGAFARNPAIPVITAKWPNQSKQTTMGMATLPSPVDMLGVQTVYGSIRIRRVSVDSIGTQANQGSGSPYISADGRYIAFYSSASNLVSGDTNSQPDAFVHDRKTAITTRVSVDSAGKEANGNSYSLDISGDGRYVVFVSDATNLVSGDTNGVRDVFVHDRQTGQTTRVSIDSNGGEGNKASGNGGSISSDGRYVAFASDATNLVSGDNNGLIDIFVHDRQTGNTIRVSVSSGGAEANGASVSPDVSGDGRLIAFQSDATNLVNGDTNGVTDIFLHDTVRGTTTRESVSSSGTQADRSCVTPAISPDGRFMIFSSSANNLVSIGVPFGRFQIYLRDLLSSTTSLASINSLGAPGRLDSYQPNISSDGRHVVFCSSSDNLVAGKSGSSLDTFIHDRQKKITTRVSVSAHGREGNDVSVAPVISADGGVIAFASVANNLVYSDTNGFPDIFVHEMEPWRMSNIPALAQQLGKPCSGTRGLPMLYLDKTWPRIGNTAFTLAIDNAQLSTIVLFGISLERQTLGLGNCTLQLSLTSIFFFSGGTDAVGRAVLPFPIPNDPWFRGLPLYTQGFVVDTGGAFVGFLAFTNGLKLLLAD